VTSVTFVIVMMDIIETPIDPEYFLFRGTREDAHAEVSRICAKLAVAVARPVVEVGPVGILGAVWEDEYRRRSAAGCTSHL
jgi:hypothetical protein